MPNESKEFMIEDAKLAFRNFSGNETDYNRAGDRNFLVILPEDVAVEMLKDGWNVKRFKDDEEGNPGDPYIQVSLKFNKFPPKVVMITSVGRTILNEDTIGSLDWADVLNVDLIARGYEWSVREKSGTKAYLKSLYITINEDPLERKYALLEQQEG